MSANGLKLLIAYNIRPDDSQAYYEFVLGHYIPTLQSLGLEVSEAWHTAYGEHPNRLVGFVARDGDGMRAVLHGEAWDELNEQLREYVTDFSYKVIPYRIGFRF
ncbi:MAG: hypothetical protein ACRDHL_04265 [Candidatus Promineifilaceae bacterium]